MLKRLILPPHQVLAVTSGEVPGTLAWLSDIPGHASYGFEAVPAGVTVRKGPFAGQTTWQFSDLFSYQVSEAQNVSLVNNVATLPSGAVLDAKRTVRYFDDFDRKAFDETNENWILNSGNDDLAVDPAIVVAPGGTAFLDAGDGDGAVAVDGSQLVWAIPVKANLGGLFCEARIQIEDISGCSVNIGFTDVTTLEEPFSIAIATLTSVASDAVCFTFDDGATLKTWHRSGVSGDTDATGNGSTGIAPVNGTYQVLRIEVDADGEGAEFFIDGVSAGRLTANACDPDTNLFFTAIIVGDGANEAAVGLTVDYVDIGHNR